MESAGFSRHYRIFLADMDGETATAKAKQVVAEVEDVLAPEGILVFDVIREFYWFEYRQINDLLAPPTKSRKSASSRWTISSASEQRHKLNKARADSVNGGRKATAGADGEAGETQL